MDDIIQILSKIAVEQPEEFVEIAKLIKEFIEELKKDKMPLAEYTKQ